MRLLLGIVYVAVGVVVAWTHHYLGHLGTVQAVISAILAVILWPLVLFHVNLHIGGKTKIK